MAANDKTVEAPSPQRSEEFEELDAEKQQIEEPTVANTETPAPDLENGQELKKKQSKSSINNTSSIPNGGLKAWLQVAGAFMLFFNSWGIINTFGAYQTFYESGTIFNESSSTISWIGAVQAFCLLFVGAITGPVYDAGHFRILIYLGAFLVVFGHMMLSLVTEFWQALLAQAFCVGIGAGTLFIPSVAIMATYFTTKMPFAIGIAASGSSLGGVVYPIVFHRLQPTIGFAWATRVIGFIALATFIVPATVMQMRVKPPAKRKLLDISAFKELPYVSFVFGSTIGFMGLYVFFFYVQFFAIEKGIVDENLGFYLLAILNAGSVFGRIVPNFVAGKLGPFNMLVPCAAMSGILPLVLIGVNNVGGVVVVTLLFGFFSGTFVSLPATCFVHLTKNRAMIGTRMGMGFTCVAVGALIGTPIAGAILGSNPSNYNFTGIWLFGGLLTLAGTVFMAGTRMLKSDWKLAAKV
ncbi:MAG: hypothetical protein M1828_001452 [Chrysothrix sp. TS-e1954]|nr:MAG: hypothetical protein M1828_001452 [Chrysothrix sp. TS-e1954]